MKDSYKNFRTLNLDKISAQAKLRKQFVQTIVGQALVKFAEYMDSDNGELSYRVVAFFGLDYTVGHHVFHRKLTEWFKDEATKISLETSIDDASEMLFRKFKKKIEH